MPPTYISGEAGPKVRGTFARGGWALYIEFVSWWLGNGTHLKGSMLSTREAQSKLSC